MAMHNETACGFREARECSCEPHQCRVQRLPTTTKARPQPCNATYYGFSAAAAIAIWLVFVAVNGGFA